MINGAPHYTNVEDSYMGYRIPAKSIVLANHFAVSRDEAAFGPNTHDFLPERWIADDGTLKDLPQTGFGFGRRICTGRHIAKNVSPRFSIPLVKRSLLCWGRRGRFLLLTAVLIHSNCLSKSPAFYGHLLSTPELSTRRVLEKWLMIWRATMASSLCRTRANQCARRGARGFAA